LTLLASRRARFGGTDPVRVRLLALRERSRLTLPGSGPLLQLALELSHPCPQPVVLRADLPHIDRQAHHHRRQLRRRHRHHPSYIVQTIGLHTHEPYTNTRANQRTPLTRYRSRQDDRLSGVGLSRPPGTELVAVQ